MAQTYTLEEAAQRIGVPVDEFKKRIKDDWKSLRSFRDGPTLRFRAADIDELARSLGEASDGGIPVPPSLSNPRQAASSDEFLLSPEDMTPLDAGDDIFSIAAGDSGKTKKPNASDSNIRLESDSGTRKKSGGSGKGKEKTGLTEEIDLDALGGGSKSGTLRSGASGKKSGESSAKLKAPKSGPNLAGPGSAAKIPGPPASSDLASTDSSSEFELSLDADSDSFELQLNTEDPSEAIDFDSDVPTRNSQSGINLDKPKDSGVSLEKTKPKSVMDDSSDDFELSLDSDSSDMEASSPLSDSGSAPVAEASDDSDSEFELSLDDNSGVTDNIADGLGEEGNQGDIFETDFSLPAVTDDAESGSEVVAVDSADTDLENSDFDLALDESDISAEDDESASQVVLLDDDSGETEPKPKKGGRKLAGAAAVGAAAVGAAALAGRKKRPTADDDVEDVEEVEDDDDAGAALAGVRRRTETDDDDAVPAGGYAPPAKWGALQVIPLFLCLIFTFLGGVMSYELLKGMWGYHNGQSPTGGIANGLAGMLGMAPDPAK